MGPVPSCLPSPRSMGRLRGPADGHITPGSYLSRAGQSLPGGWGPMEAGVFDLNLNRKVRSPCSHSAKENSV